MLKHRQPPTLLGFWPSHFEMWADSIKVTTGYESQLVRFLRDLARELREGKIKEV